MSTETFVETNKNKIHTWQVRVVVERTPATVSDLNQKSRWFQTVGAEVVTVERVKIMRTPVDVPKNPPYTEEGFEVTFRCGARGFIPTGRQGWDELDALVVGTKGYLHGLAVWRKHGRIVGGSVPWFRCQPSKRARQNANTAPKCCAAELYARAAGKPWGERPTLDDATKPLPVGWTTRGMVQA